MSFTRWRSLVDGTEVDVGPAIPDGDVYLHDDWGDGKLQDRDDSGTTNHNGVEGVYRPEWNIDRGSPTVVNEQAELDGSDDTADQMRTELNLNFDEEITWEITDADFGDNQGSGGGDVTGLGLFANTETWNDEEYYLHESYYIVHRTGANIELRHADENGSETTLISGDDGSEYSHPIDYEITRQSDGVWELVINGTSLGTATDTSTDTVEYVGFGNRETGGNEAHSLIDEFKVF